jgi:hypothetical protein
MIKLKSLIREEDYQGEHSAPDKGSGYPLHNLSGIYPDDVYSFDAARLYGDGGGDFRDRRSIATIQWARHNPNGKIKIYRAVPKILSSGDRIYELEKQKRYILKYGKVPPNVNTPLDKSSYYDQISTELDRFRKLPLETNPPKMKINNGDWVSINKDYAVEHGKSNLNNDFKVLTKTVPAKHLYTFGDSVHEWGYDPL